MQCSSRFINHRHCGRCVNGLPLHKKEFGVLPPHFKASPEAVQAVSDAIPLLFPDIADRDDLRGVLSFCLASVVYHADSGWIRESLTAEHPIFHHKLFTHSSLLSRLASLLVYRGPISWEENGSMFYCKEAFDSPVLRASGVAPFGDMINQLTEVSTSVNLMREQVGCFLDTVDRELAEKIGEFQEQVLSSMSKLLDDKGAHAGNLTERTFCDWIQRQGIGKRPEFSLDDIRNVVGQAIAQTGFPCRPEAQIAPQPEVMDVDKSKENKL